MSRRSNWDVAHESNAVPIDVREDTVCEAKRVDGKVVRSSCKAGFTIAYDAPEGPKVRHVQADDPGVQAAVTRYRSAQRGDSAACSCACNFEAGAAYMRGILDARRKADGFGDTLASVGADHSPTPLPGGPGTSAGYMPKAHRGSIDPAAPSSAKPRAGEVTTALDTEPKKRPGSVGGPEVPNIHRQKAAVKP